MSTPNWRSLPGAEAISDAFCNQPTRVDQHWTDDEPIAAILLCGRLRGHEGDCDPTPPLSDVAI